MPHILLISPAGCMQRPDQELDQQDANAFVTASNCFNMTFDGTLDFQSWMVIPSWKKLAKPLVAYKNLVLDYFLYFNILWGGLRSNWERWILAYCGKLFRIRAMCRESLVLRKLLTDFQELCWLISRIKQPWIVPNFLG